MAPIHGRGRAFAHASSVSRRANNRPLVQNGSVLRLGAETDRLLVDVQSDIVITSHTGPPDLVSEPAHNGWSQQHFCSTIRRTSLPIHSNNLCLFLDCGETAELDKDF